MSECIQRRKEEQYKIYITDSLRILTGAELRYVDLVSEEGPEAKESANSIIKRLSEGLDRIGSET